MFVPSLASKFVVGNSKFKDVDSPGVQSYLFSQPMFLSKTLVNGAFRVYTSARRSFHLGHEYTPPARFMNHHVKFTLALFMTAIQMSTLLLLYLNADKIRPPPPRKLSEEVGLKRRTQKDYSPAEAEVKRRAELFKDGTMSLKKF
ncbi:unnamed protein product [Thelazia callipaeda]|uniref:Transmembrane protein n=1 Tax=Thelazia callipaeda TaxID=103827 RepID=A0A0N5CPQ4_THECL|nr:unnamed protein product [Thelazia callipaeda]